MPPKIPFVNMVCLFGFVKISDMFLLQFCEIMIYTQVLEGVSYILYFLLFFSPSFRSNKNLTSTLSLVDFTKTIILGLPTLLIDSLLNQTKQAML